MTTVRHLAFMGSAALVIGLVGPGAATAANRAASDAAGQIVFQAPVNDHWQLFVENADGSNVRRLVTSGDDDLAPSISPDGRRVVFFRIFSNGSPDKVFLVNVDGSNLHALDIAGCAETCLGDDTEGQAWSPDGTQIAFERALLDPSEQVNVGLWVMNADGARPHQITQRRLGVESEDHRPDWSPDGTRLVFQRIDRTRSPEMAALFTVRGDGTDARQITPWGLDPNDPAWSPDDADRFPVPGRSQSGR